MTDDEHAQMLADRAYSLVKHSISLPYPEDSDWRIDDDGNLHLTVKFDGERWKSWEKDDE